ncbi:MAG: protein kinase [Chloroflexi bacterium]|nr:protein kinase [Chloroflexota bacterium]
MNCPRCRHSNGDDQRFCVNCGAALTAACASCGTSLEAGARFCGQCGKPVADASGDQTVVAPSPVASSQRDLPDSFGNGRYQVQRFLGEGGVKRVYLAHDTKLDSNVAVAAIKDELGPEAAARIEREVQSMVRLRDHPHIANIHDIGGDGASTYIVQEFMEGGSIADALRAAPENRLSIPEVIKTSSQICQALAFAHSQGIVHRDVKPENVWLTADGTAKLGDFGLSIALDSSRLTQAGTMLGTVAYMPPELAVGGTREADVRCDLYSLGAMMYEMAAGRPPFAGTDPVAIISQHISTAPVAPSWHNAAVPKPLEAIILKLLEKRPEERPESAKAVAEQLDALAANMDPASSDGADLAGANPIDRIAGGVFVGREDETKELRTALASAISGEGKIVLLTGEPGIGKTRLAEELATYARLRDAQVLWGRCHERAGQPSYWPWVQAIRSYVHSRDLQALESDMGSGAADIAQVVTEIRDRLPGLATPPALDPEQARFRLFDSITTFLKNASNREPLVIVLDDIQWADEASLLLLQFLAKEIQSSRVLVICTVRDTELDREQPAARVLAELAKEPVTSSIALTGLTTDDITQFVELSTGKVAAPGLAGALFKQAEGNPFVTSEIVKLLASDGRLDEGATSTSWSVAIPDGVRAIVTRRLEHLSEPCRDFLASAAVVGRAFDLRVVERVAGVSVEAAVDALDEAASARLVEELEEGTGRYQFSHAITRDTLYQDQPPSRRLELHRAVGERLESIYGTESAAHIGQLAYHFAEAAKAGTAEKAVAYARKAGDQALARLAYEDAVGHYRRAVQALAFVDQQSDKVRAELLLAQGTAAIKTAGYKEAKKPLWEALGIAKEIGDVRLFTLSTLAFSRSAFEAYKVEPERVAMLEDALKLVGESDAALRARLCSELASALQWSADPGRRDELGDEALTLSREAHDSEGRLDILVSWIEANYHHDRLDQRLEVCHELIDAGQEFGSIWHEAEGNLRLYTSSLEAGDVPGADEAARLFRNIVEKGKINRYAGWVAAYPAMKAIFEGRLEEADVLVPQTLAAFQSCGEPDALLRAGFQLMTLRTFQGRLAELEPAIRGVVTQYGETVASRVIMAFYWTQAGNLEEAREEWELAKEHIADLSRDPSWFETQLMLAEVCAFVEDAERANTLYELIGDYADRNGVLSLGAVCTGSVAHQAALLAVTAGRLDEAEMHFETALVANERMGTRPFLARTQFAYARMLLKRDGEGDDEKARELIADSLETAEEIGMPKLVSDIVALKLELQGVTIDSVANSIETVARTVLAERPDLRPHAAPDGTVTLLFTDIVGSTPMNERLGDKHWMELLREHNAIVREHVSAHQGYEVKTAGDGFMLAFSSARRAVDCAMAIQRGIAERNASADETIEVRAGLHTGEAIQEDGDFYGRHVNLAARIAAHASAGQILVSSLLKELTNSTGDIDFDSGTEVELKGISETQQLFAVGWQVS